MSVCELMMYDSEECLEVRYYRCFQLVMDLQSLSAALSLNVNLSILSLELLIKLAYPATKYQCTPLRVEELVVHRTPSQRRVTVEGVEEEGGEGRVKFHRSDC